MEARTSQKYELNGFDLNRLRFDGHDHDRFKEDKEYQKMTEWITVGDSNSTTWDRKEPVQGVFVNMQTHVGPHKRNIYTLKTKDGEVDVWGSTVLDSKFEQVPRGSEVRIEFLGMAEGKSGLEYADYKFQYREVPMQDVVDASDVTELDGII